MEFKAFEGEAGIVEMKFEDKVKFNVWTAKSALKASVIDGKNNFNPDIKADLKIAAFELTLGTFEIPLPFDSMMEIQLKGDALSFGGSAGYSKNKGLYFGRSLGAGGEVRLKFKER